MADVEVRGPEDSITVKQAAEMLGVSRVRVLQLVKAGTIRVVGSEVFPGRPRLWLSISDIQRRIKQ